MNTHGKYGEVAVKAFEYMRSELEASSAWERASCEVFEKGSSSQTKGCPRNAFIGLVSDNPDAQKSKNAIYALDALEILRSNPTRNYSKKELWELAVGQPKKHNSQMDVVLALWDNKLVN